jgi:hypothetical protein
MDEDLQRRIRRIYSAIQATEDNDISHYPPVLTMTEKMMIIHQDWRGDMTHEELENDAHTAVHNIANLYDHLRHQAARSGVDKRLVDDAACESLAIQIVRDLSNNDKHGYPTRDRGYSTLAPKLQNVSRVLRVSTGKQSNSGVSVSVSLNHVTQTKGSNSAKVIITGEVVDSDGNTVGDLHSFLVEAVDA